MDHLHAAARGFSSHAADMIERTDRTPGLELEPPRLGPFTTGYLAVSHHIPIDGTAQVTLFENGDVHAAGRLHNAGFPSYDVRLVWMFKTAAGNSYALAVEGHIAGKLEAGRREFAWSISGTSKTLADNWADVAGGGTQRWAASVTLDLAQLLQHSRHMLGVSGGVVMLA